MEKGKKTRKTNKGISIKCVKNSNNSSSKVRFITSSNFTLILYMLWRLNKVRWKMKKYIYQIKNHITGNHNHKTKIILLEINKIFLQLKIKSSKNKQNKQVHVVVPQQSQKGHMKIMVWNCQGIRQSLTVRELKFQIKNKNPKFIFLSETKCKSNELRKKAKINHEWNSICINPRGQ